MGWMAIALVHLRLLHPRIFPALCFGSFFPSNSSQLCLPLISLAKLPPVSLLVGPAAPPERARHDRQQGEPVCGGRTRRRWPCIHGHRRSDPDQQHQTARAKICCQSFVVRPEVALWHDDEEFRGRIWSCRGGKLHTGLEFC